MTGLVLRRKEGETITLRLPDGSRIVIGLTKCKNGAASVVIEAPNRVEIARTELVEEAETVNY